MRIVSLTPVATETLVLLGLEDELVGVTPYCRLYLSSMEGKTIVGTCLRVDLDKLYGLRPDLVITQEPVQSAIAGELMGKGFQVYRVRAHTNIHDIIATVVDLGTLTGRYWEAREIAASLEERLLRVLSKTRQIPGPERPRVFVDHFWNYQTSSTVGGLSYVDDGVWVAGGINVFHDVLRGFFDANYEEAAARDPDVILVSVEPHYRMTVEKYVKLRPAVRRMRAYEEGRIHIIPEGRKVNLNHPGPSFIDTVEYLYALLRY